jgi:hypothetical protein
MCQDHYSGADYAKKEVSDDYGTVNGEYRFGILYNLGNTDFFNKISLISMCVIKFVKCNENL